MDQKYNLIHRFAAAEGGPIDVDGRDVYAALRFAVEPGSELKLRWLGTHARWEQAILLHFNGSVKVGRDRHSPPDVLQFRESASPEEVTFELGPDCTNVLVHNGWRSPEPGGRILYNMGGAALAFHRDGEFVIFACSDGGLDGDFSNLRFSLRPLGNQLPMLERKVKRHHPREGGS